MLILGIIAKFAGGIEKLDATSIPCFRRRCTLAGVGFFMKKYFIQKNTPCRNKDSKIYTKRSKQGTQRPFWDPECRISLAWYAQRREIRKGCPGKWINQSHSEPESINLESLNNKMLRSSKRCRLASSEQKIQTSWTFEKTYWEHDSHIDKSSNAETYTYKLRQSISSHTATFP